MNYQLGLYEKSMPNELSLKEKLTICKKYGFDFLELSIDESDEKLSRLNWSSDEINDLKKAMMDTNMFIESICLSGHRKYPLGSHDEDIRLKSLEIMEKTIDLASQLGVRYILISGYDVYYEESDEQTQQYFLENLKKSVEMASNKGVILAFETMETPFMNTVEKAMYYVDLIDSPYLQVYPDIGNLKNASLIYKHNVYEDIKKGKGHIVAGHLKETIPGHYREIPFGEGHVDFEQSIKVLLDLGVRRFVGEFWYKGENNWEENVSFANTFLSGKIANAIKNFVSS